MQQFEALTDHQQAFHQQDARWSSLMPALVADFATISGIRERIEAATVTRGDLKILQQALQNKSQQAHQLSQYNITIGEINDGQNIQIGDRTYVEINDEAVQAIVAAIRQSLNLDSPLQRMGAPFQAPPLPSYYVDRPEVSQDLKARLLQPKAANGSAAAALMISAIHGLGAIGKSTLATALAHDPDVRRHFSDGILWVTLDQQPNLLELLQSWVRALGDHVFRVENEAAASRHLQTLLQDKAMLLVVDDAWSTADARHFVVNASRCQVLVTTRDASIAEGLRATNYPLDVMSPEQAMQLIARKLQQEFSRELQEQEREPAAALTKAVGYLPLALDLAVAQVATGRFSWDVLLQDLEKEVARLKSFDRPNTRDEKKEGELKQASLIASLNLSIQNLGSEDEREYFIWLGVLPKDAAFSSKLAVTLWNLEDERDAEDSLKYLRSKALLLPSVPLADGTLTYRLHDLIHDLACNLLEASPTPRKLGDLKGLGLKLAAAHAELLERYRQKTQNPLWHSLPNDGYIHERLVWHLERAGWVDEIHALLGETAETGRNGWYEARDRLGQTAGYISDVRQAWDLADRAAAESLSPQIMGWQCRYALITASLNSVSDIPGELLLALVKKQVWMPEQGLAYARQAVDPQLKAGNLTLLVDELPASLKPVALREALEAAQAIRDESSRSCALAALADELPEVLPQALKAAQAIWLGEDRSCALAALADKLPELLPQALAAAQASHGEARFRALAALADKLPELLPQALGAALAIGGEEDRSCALAALVGKLPELLPQALEAALAIGNEYSRSRALAALVGKLPELLPQALETALAIGNEYSRSYALATLADKLPVELLPQALKAVQAIGNGDAQYRFRALATLADKLPVELLPQALKAAQAIRDESSRSRALAALADKLPVELLPQALEAALAIRNESSRSRALAALADKLPLELLPQVLEATQAIEMEYFRSRALAALADKLPELLPQALEAALAIEMEYFRCEALAALADKLPVELLPQALAAALAIRDEYSRSLVLTALAKKFPELLPQALEAALAIRDGPPRSCALADLADELPVELLPQALAAALAIEMEYSRSLVLTALAKKFPELLPQALEAALAIRDGTLRSLALAALANKLPVELLPQALEAAQAIRDEEARSRALAALADKLPELLPQALETALAIGDEPSRFRALAALADKLPVELLPQALEAAQAVEDEKHRFYTLKSLFPQFIKFPTLELCHHWVIWLKWLAMLRRPAALECLASLVPIVDKLGEREAVAAIANAIDDVCRWWQ